MTSLYALGLGIGSKNKKGEWLEVFYPKPLLSPSVELVSLFTGDQSINTTNDAGVTIEEVQCDRLSLIVTALRTAGFDDIAETLEPMAHSNRPLVLVCLADNAAPKGVPDTYLKLHLLSHRLVQPHETVLDGMFGVLPNVAWTNQGPIDIEELPEQQLRARCDGNTLSVDCVDKFPKMTDYVVPAGVRIADTSRVRLGAYIGNGTTIMHEGFVNFNAGTLGTSMVEGRISAGVVVGKGSDLGGGCSTMGTLSGGGNIVISVGEESLIGANAGIGIPLGDRCIVESGLYITAGAKITLLDDKGQIAQTIKARDLAGKSDLLFRRNSQNGCIECLTNKSAIALNEELHANN